MKEDRKPASPMARIDTNGGGEAQLGNDSADQERDVEIEPLLVAYFASRTASSSAFIKSVIAAGIDRFDDADQIRALELMVQQDITGDRLWALASSARLPPPIDRWIWRAIQERLSGILGHGFVHQESDAKRILTTTCEMLRRKVASEAESESKAARNWVRLTALWLMERRALKVWDAAEALQPVLLGDRTKIESVANRSISKGPSSMFDAALAGAGLALDQVREARAKRDERVAEVVELQARLKAAKEMVDQLGKERSQISDELTVTKEELAAAQLRNQQQRQHWGHDLTETEAKQKSLLERGLSPLVNDAIDALEIGRPEIAQERLIDLRAAILKAASQ